MRLIQMPKLQREAWKDIRSDPDNPEDFFHRVACYDEDIQHGLVAQELYRAGGLPGQ